MSFPGRYYFQVLFKALESLPADLIFKGFSRKLSIFMYCTAIGSWERGGSVVECLTGDGTDAGSSLTCFTALWSLSKTHLS